MTFRKYQTYFFVGALIASAILTLVVFRSYLVSLAIGGVIAVLARPFYRQALRLLRSRSVSAFVVLLLVIAVFILPLVYFLLALASEIGGVIGDIRGHLGIAEVGAWLQKTLPVSLQAQIPTVITQLESILKVVISRLSEGVIGLFSNVVGATLNALVVFIGAYYLLKDGDRLKAEYLRLSPLSDVHDEKLVNSIGNSIRAVISGILVISLIKGILSGLAFWGFGVPAPFFWGTMSGLAFFVPIVGSAIVTVPAVIYLFVTGHIGAAIGLTIVSSTVIGLIDNLLQPKLVESQTKIHPLLILLSILGGLEFYGFSGFILGPLTLTVTMALLGIYDVDFHLLRDEDDAPSNESSPPIS